MPRSIRAACAAALLAASTTLAGPAAAQVDATQMDMAPGHAAPPAAQPAPAGPASIVIAGRVRTTRTLDLSGLQALPAVTVEVQAPPPQGQGAQGAGAQAPGPRTVAFTGALLWPLLLEAGPLDAPGRATQNQHTLMAQGRDGYAVALAFGEMDPHLEGKQVLVAYAQDGKPLPAPRLVVPGDSHAGRGVRDLVLVTVR